eukprot:GHVU01201233.1.p1 GENE.GHVU01201233.1~~GHVU01201233.1.p1  ORF type:complete len:140 (+),score=7.69 GHVU01201233.1:1906-2325(+)
MQTRTYPHTRTERTRHTHAHTHTHMHNYIRKRAHIIHIQLRRGYVYVQQLMLSAGQVLAGIDSTAQLVNDAGAALPNWFDHFSVSPSTSPFASSSSATATTPTCPPTHARILGRSRPPTLAGSNPQILAPPESPIQLPR